MILVLITIFLGNVGKGLSVTSTPVFDGNSTQTPIVPTPGARDLVTVTHRLVLPPIKLATLPPLPPPVFVTLPPPVFVTPSEFPFEEFYNISENTRHSFRGYKCKKLSHMIDRYGDPEAPPCCDCNTDCWKYGTCCVDVLWNVERPIDLQRYLQQFIAKRRQYKQLTCEKVLSVSETPIKHQLETMNMVSTCLNGANETDIELCNNGLPTKAKGYVPVLGFDNYLYKNRFCALCNNVSQYEYMNLNVKCVNAGNIKKKMTIVPSEFDKLDECIITIERTPLNNDYLKKCVRKTLISDCSEQNKQLCNSYQAPTEKHTNYHCRKCDTSSNHTSLADNFFQCPKQCGRGLWCNLPDGKDLSKYPHTFDISVSDFKDAFQISNLRQKFPIWKFLQIPPDFEFQKDEGLEQYLCSGRRTRCCDCNNNCMEGDRKCCVDKFWNETKPVDMETYKERLLEESDKVKDRFCLPIYPSATSIGYSSSYYLMVRSCLINSNELDKVNCLTDPLDSSPSSNIPVFGADGVLYKNSFCAKCNLIMDYHYVSFTFNCDEFVINDQDFQNNGTNSTLAFDLKQRVRDCEFSLKVNRNFVTPDNCNPSSKNQSPKRQCSFQNPNYGLCKSYYGKIGNYKNYHCSKCNSDNSVTARLINYCDPPPPCRSFYCPSSRVEPEVEIPFLKRVYRWSFTLTFSDTTSNIKFDDSRGSLRSSCTEGETYDIDQAKCVKFTCPLNYDVVGLNCVFRVQMSKKIPNIHQIPSPNVGLFDKLEHIFLAAFDFTVYVLFPSGVERTDAELSRNIGENFTFSYLVNTTDDTIKQSNEVVTLQVLKNITKYLETPNADNLTKDGIRIVIALNVHYSLVSQTYGLDFSRIFSGNRLCVKPSVLPLQEINLNRNDSTLLHQNETFSLTNVSYWLDFQNNAVSRRFSVCKKYHLTEPCPRKLLQKSEVTKGDNMTIMQNTSSGSQVYKPNQYIPTINGFFVCINTTNRRPPKFKRTNQDLERLYNVEYYISIVGTSVSVVCYFWIIATYVMFKDLRTVPGLNNCFMCASLLIADVMFLSAPEASKNNASCVSVAVMMHWGLLAAFTWTLIVSFDLVSRFGSFSMHFRDRDLERMTHRAAIGFLGPAIVVSIAVGLDREGIASIGYGAQNICWITNSQARLGLYIIPTAVAIFIALVSLCYTVFKISKEKKKGENYLGARKGSKVSFIRMAAKLAMILGVTEIVGYVQIPTSNLTNNEETFNASFGFLYSLIRSFRGVMLWFVYIYSGPIVKRFKKRMMRSVRRTPGRKMGESTASTMTLETMTTDDSYSRKASNAGL